MASIDGIIRNSNNSGRVRNKASFARRQKELANPISNQLRGVITASTAQRGRRMKVSLPKVKTTDEDDYQGADRD